MGQRIAEGENSQQDGDDDDTCGWFYTPELTLIQKEFLYQPQWMVFSFFFFNYPP
jgi:hypothetical protein